MSTSITQLEDALLTLHSTTTRALSTSHTLSRRSRYLATLTSPATETSTSLTQASTNLTSTLALLRDAREKFDTAADCEPSIDRLYRGAKDLVETRNRRDRPSNIYNVPNDTSSIIDGIGRRIFNDDDTMTVATLNGTIVGLTEQDVYAAADSLEILRDAHVFFHERSSWKSSKGALTNIERVHQLGVDGMCNLIKCHLHHTGPAIRIKRALTLLRNADDATIDTRGVSTIATNTTFGTRKLGGPMNSYALETARDTRERLSAALQNRDLMKSVGEYEESLPLDTRTVRELRAMFECLGGNGCFLNPATKPSAESILKELSKHQAAAAKVSRTEKIGSGYYTKLSMKNLESGYPHLDAYAEARRTIAYNAMQLFYRQLRDERKKEWDKTASSGRDMAELESGELDSSARDAVRCLEHAMVIVAGEKSIYRCVVSPTSSHNHDTSKVPLEYKYALVASYSSVCSAVVDRVLDIIELFFVKDAALRNTLPNASSSNLNEGMSLGSDLLSHGTNASAVPSVRFAASAAAAGLRILDAVRMLGPSLAKLCEMASNKLQLQRVDSVGSVTSKDSSSTLASNLCIAVHRMTVKNVGKALENLALSVKHDPISGEKFRPQDASVAPLTSDAVRAIRLVSPFVSAYKSVTKRRPLPWDPKVGDAAGEMDFFIRYLIMSLLANLQAKGTAYAQDPGPVAEAKSHLFLVNNTYYLSEQLKYNYIPESSAPILLNIQEDIDGNDFKIRGEWFSDQVNKLFVNSKKKYLQYWDSLNEYLRDVANGQLTYTNPEQKLLTLESGRLLKARFSGFNDTFERMYESHRHLTIFDSKLREIIISDVKNTFLPRYEQFFSIYSKYQFSKKNMDDYLKYRPDKVGDMLSNMFVS